MDFNCSNSDSETAAAILQRTRDALQASAGGTNMYEGLLLSNGGTTSMDGRAAPDWSFTQQAASSAMMPTDVLAQLRNSAAATTTNVLPRHQHQQPSQPSAISGISDMYDIAIWQRQLQLEKEARSHIAATAASFLPNSLPTTRDLLSQHMKQQQQQPTSPSPPQELVGGQSVGRKSAKQRENVLSGLMKRQRSKMIDGYHDDNRQEEEQEFLIPPTKRQRRQRDYYHDNSTNNIDTIATAAAFNTTKKDNICGDNKNNATIQQLRCSKDPSLKSFPLPSAAAQTKKDRTTEHRRRFYESSKKFFHKSTYRREWKRLDAKAKMLFNDHKKQSKYVRINFARLFHPPPQPNNNKNNNNDKKSPTAAGGNERNNNNNNDWSDFRY